MALTPYNHNAQPGDLIEIFRPLYQHWALYIGGNEVVHLTTPGSCSGSFGVMMTVLSRPVGIVERQKIWEVVGNGRFQINNLLDDMYKPRDCGVIVREACELVCRELPYNAATYNCEHFVTGLRYGEPESRQVQTASVIGGATILGAGAMALGAVLFGGLRKDDEEDQREGRRGSRHRDNSEAE